MVDVVAALAERGLTVSIDTTRAEVAAAAIGAGAGVVNDVSGGLADPDMARVVADTGVRWILMHWRGHSRDMQRLAHYDSVVADVKAELEDRVEAALESGVDASKLVVDPGLGFAKTAEHNWRLSAHLHEFVELGYPVLFASSRKSYLGSLLADDSGKVRPVGQREAATLATSVLAFEAGAWGCGCTTLPAPPTRGRCGWRPRALGERALIRPTTWNGSCNAPGTGRSIRPVLHPEQLRGPAR
ncbi:hypothetical protein GCM10029992_18820 [Glycomyces albus]